MARGGDEQQRARQGQPPRGGGGRAGARPRGRWRTNIAQRLRAYLFAGIIVTAPLGITLLIVREVVRYFDGTVATLLPARYNPETYMPFSLPGIGVVVVLAFLILVGWSAAGAVGRTVMRTGEGILDRTPVVRAIYGTLKQVFETIFTQSSRAFREVVLVEFPQPGSFALGFVTGTAGPEIQRASEDDGTGIVGSGGGELANVLIPMSPFPSSGFLLFVPKERLIRLDMTIEEGMKVVISGGIVTPPARDPAVAVPAGAAPAGPAPAADGGTPPLPPGLTRPAVLAGRG
jgi:uncharacterized membrane protein